MSGGVPPELERELKALQKLQADGQQLITVQQKLLTQKTECEMVQEELTALPEDAAVYKLVGPVLVKQEREEALANIGTRLGFIKSSLTSTEASLQEMQRNQTEQKKVIMEMQQKMQVRAQ